MLLNIALRFIPFCDQHSHYEYFKFKSLFQCCVREGFTKIISMWAWVRMPEVSLIEVKYGF